MKYFVDISKIMLIFLESGLSWFSVCDVWNILDVFKFTKISDFTDVNLTNHDPELKRFLKVKVKERLLSIFAEFAI